MTLRTDAHLHLRKTFSFLNRNGQRLLSCQEVQLTGDLLAFVKVRGGFYAFRTQGQEDVARGPSIILYDHDFQETERKKGNRLSIQFTVPEQCYVASVSHGSITEITEEYWYGPNSETRNFLLDRGKLEWGVYRITNDELVERIKGVLGEEGKRR